MKKITFLYKFFISAFALAAILCVSAAAQNSRAVDKQPQRSFYGVKNLPGIMLGDESIKPDISQRLKRDKETQLDTILRTVSTEADGDLDPSFAPNVENYPGAVRSSVLQGDGKLIIAGFFKKLNGVEHWNIARFNADGSIDASFNARVNDLIYSVVLQPDGKILIGGTFTNVNGTARNRIARLNADGSLDTGFNPGAGTDGAVFSISLQSDGKIIGGGIFTKFDGNDRNNLFRLNADGSLDMTFSGLLDAFGFIVATAVEPSGRILIGGLFTSPGGMIVNFFGRLNGDGSFDSSFNPGLSANSTVRDIEIQADGKILIGGSFTSYNGTTRNRLARLNADGSLDTSFNSSVGANNAVYSITALSGGKAIISGFFTTYGGTARNFIAQVNSDGSLDTSFNPGTGFNGVVYSTTLMPSNRIFAGGNVTNYNDFWFDLGVVLNANGSHTTIISLISSAAGNVRAIVNQPDGKLLVGGSFNLINGVNHNGLVRLNANGTIDTGFTVGAGPNGQVYAVALQPDGKILAGGNFTTFGGAARNRIVRLNSNGSVDMAFNTSLNAPVSNIVLQPDGKILIGGSFFTINGASCQGIARLNSDGTLDATFTVPEGAEFVEGIVVQPDGKIVIGGKFITIGGEIRLSIARLNANGSLDSSFDSPAPPNAGIYSMALQADGKILVGGVFSTIGGINNNQKGIARLNSNGTLDSSFNVGTGTDENADVEDIVLQSNGKILIGGAFNSINGVSRSNLARLNADGSLDSSFNPSADSTVWDINIAGQKILIGGDFIKVNGTERLGAARLALESTAPRAPFDFDGDGKTDISIFRPAVGEWWINRSTAGTIAYTFGTSSDRIVPADYTADGKTDVAIWRPSTGEWFILRSEDSSYYSFPFGTSGDIPAPADFDGDNQADVGVFRPSTATWYITLSSGKTLIQQFGANGDAPVAADYDGDGKSDIAIYRASLGEWWIQKSTNNSVITFQFGNSADKPVQGDYTGDGIADVAIWRPSTGEWFILRSENYSYYSFPFGISTDIPAPGDYDGDGRADAAVYRPADTNWYLLRSTAGFTAVQFGLASDRPVPNAFVP